MAKEKRDHKNRLLWHGERQRADGKYEYRWTDEKGERHSVYSWKLVQTDRLPKGKPDCRALRELEGDILRDKHDGIDTNASKNLCLDDLFKINMETRHLKESTRVNYTYMYYRTVSPVLGTVPIGAITYTDIKRFYYDLIENKGFKPNSMEIINTIIHPIFTQAVRDGIIRINPTDGVMGEIKRGRDWEKTKRQALTEEQQTAFITYVCSHKVYKHWKLIFTFMLGTGCRVGEAVGLRWEDCDFENGIININHNLIYRMHQQGGCDLMITTPKTKAGVREIPMFDEVKKVLLEEKKRQEEEGPCKVVIDGYKGFIFCNRFGGVLMPHEINRAIDRITRDYNREETEKAKVEGRPPLLLPHFSSHILRHTFCTRMCENTSNQNTLKMIQEIMGHCDISTTLDVYTDLTRPKKQAAFAELQDKIRLA